MGQVRLYVLAALVLGAVGALGFGGRQVYKAGYTAAVVEQQKLVLAQRTIADELDRNLAKHISTIQVKHVTIRQNLEKELTRDVVYRDCAASPGVLQLTNEALSGRANAPASGLMSAPDTAE